ncbi:MAG TPA: MBL fold metallo-hydrolase [Longimicrobiaceae bacterium]|nr:MBL fold metallo-hydrolase [Longimicrobiaceae bacterium]
MDPSPRPAHHLPDGRFRVPWPMEGADERGAGALLRWQWERLTRRLPPNPAPGSLPLAPGDVAHPRAPADEVRLTWVGHATFLVQMGGLNLLTDPVWSRRASPLRWAGPARFVPPGVAWDRLPPIDAVLLSHDHYDHLDDGTVRGLHRRFGDRLRWLAPLAYREWLGARGIRNVAERDWWESVELEGEEGPLRATCLPVQHWTRRGLRELNDRLWGSWMLEAGGRRVYFAGDSGYFGGFREIGERFGPLDAALVPIGAYEPRWFMRPAHMNPEEAVRTYLDLGGSGVFAGMHWGTFRLTDEDPLEPPVRTRAAWADAGLPPERLWIPRHGETRVVPRPSPAGAAG